MIELAELVLAKTRSRSELVRLPLPEDDPKQRKPDISVAQSKLGWVPEIPLDRGLDNTIAYFRELTA
jgi:nucleoside-diphosphate-sugar epimerase